MMELNGCRRDAEACAIPAILYHVNQRNFLRQLAGAKAAADARADKKKTVKITVKRS